MANIIKGLLPSGKAPSVLKSEIIELVKTEAPAPDLTPFATKTELGDYATKEELGTRIEEAEAAFLSAEALQTSVQEILSKVIVRSQTPPDQTDYAGIPVLWLDTRQKSAWNATPPYFSEVTGRGTIPEDEGVIYHVKNEVKPAGEYSLTKGETWAVRAVPKVGYTLTGPTTWELTYHGLTSLEALAAEIRKDAPEHHLALAGANPYQDLGTSPATWAATATPVIDGWGMTGSSVTTTAKDNFFTHNASAWTFEAVVEPLGKKGTHEYSGDMLRDDRYVTINIGYNAVVTASTGDASVPGGGKSISSSPVTVAKEPTHIAVVFDGSSLKTYINGVQAASGEGYKRTYVVGSNTRITVGSLYSKIGQMAFYRKALAPARISAHAQAVGSA